MACLRHLEVWSIGEYRHGSFVRAVRPRWGRLGWYRLLPVGSSYSIYYLLWV